MSRSRRARLDTLQKRMDFLEKRITEAEVGGYNLSYDKAERNALQWAIPILQGHLEANKILHDQLRSQKEENESTG